MSLSTMMDDLMPTGVNAPASLASATANPYAGLNPDQQREAKFLESIKARKPSDYLDPSGFYGTGMDRWVKQDPYFQRYLSQNPGDDVGDYRREFDHYAQQYAGMDDTTATNTLQANWLKYGQDNVDFWKQHPSGTDYDWMDKAVETAMPLIVGATFGGGLLSALGDGAGAAGAASSAGGLGSSAAEMGLGSIPIDSAGLQSLGWMDGALGASGTAGAAGGVGSLGAAGLGSMVGVEGGAPAVVSIGAPAAGGGALSSSFGGIGSAIGGSLPIDNALLQSIPNSIGGAPSSSSYNFPSGLGSLFNSAGNLLGANTDRIHNQQDSEYWQNLMNKAMGMYQPGTPEATLMENKMNAQDAAAGRNSQYGVRATNLAGMLADQRAKIMTSPSFYNMGAASRGHYDNSLNSLFAAMGQNGSSGGGSYGGLGSFLGNLANTTSGGIGNIGTSLSDMLGGWGGI